MGGQGRLQIILLPMASGIPIRAYTIPIRYCTSRNGLGASDHPGFLDGIYRVQLPSAASGSRTATSTIYSHNQPPGGDFYMLFCRCLNNIFEHPSAGTHDINSGCN